MAEAMTALGVLEASPPRFSPAEIAGIAADLFGVRGDARDLGSERDQTFLVDGPDGSGILKVSNLAEDPLVLDFETAALEHIARADPELPVARQLAAPDGGYRPTVRGPDGDHYVRLFQRLCGRSMALGDQLDDAALAAYGATTARLAAALRSFFHTGAGRRLLWDTANASELRPLAGSIADPRQRGLVTGALDLYEERALPAWPRLRAQVVHGDLALDNVLLDERGFVCGIIDFGDLVHTALLVDLVAALASALRGRPPADVYRSARLFLDGYQSRTPLEPLELELLPVLLGARLATIVTISAWRVVRYPENAEYIEAWDAATWPLLEQLAADGPDRARRELTGTGATVADAELAERRRRVLGLGADGADLLAAGPPGARRGHLADRRRRTTAAGRLQQRAGGRPLPSPGHRGRRPPDAGPEHPCPVSLRAADRARRAAGGDDARGIRPGHRDASQLRAARQTTSPGRSPPPAPAPTGPSSPASPTTASRR